MKLETCVSSSPNSLIDKGKGITNYCVPVTVPGISGILLYFICTIGSLKKVLLFFNFLHKGIEVHRG